MTINLYVSPRFMKSMMDRGSSLTVLFMQRYLVHGDEIILQRPDVIGKIIDCMSR